MRPVQIAGCVIQRDGKFLLVQEKQPKAFGLWNIPAGHLDEGESLEEAAVREVKEETGFDVEISHALGVHKDDKHEFFPFAAKIVRGELIIPPEEMRDAKWLSFEAVKKLNDNGKMRSFWQFEAIKSVIEGS